MTCNWNIFLFAIKLVLNPKLQYPCRPEIYTLRWSALTPQIKIRAKKHTCKENGRLGQKMGPSQISLITRDVPGRKFLEIHIPTSPGNVGNRNENLS